MRARERPERPASRRAVPARRALLGIPRTPRPPHRRQRRHPPGQPAPATPPSAAPPVPLIHQRGPDGTSPLPSQSYQANAGTAVLALISPGREGRPRDARMGVMRPSGSCDRRRPCAGWLPDSEADQAAADRLAVTGSAVRPARSSVQVPAGRCRLAGAVGMPRCWPAMTTMAFSGTAKACQHSLPIR